MTKNPGISGYSRSRGKQFTATASRKQNGTNSPTQLRVFHDPMETRKCKIEKQTRRKYKKIYYDIVQEKKSQGTSGKFRKVTHRRTKRFDQLKRSDFKISHAYSWAARSDRCGAELAYPPCAPQALL